MVLASLAANVDAARGEFGGAFVVESPAQQRTIEDAVTHNDDRRLPSSGEELGEQIVRAAVPERVPQFDTGGRACVCAPDAVAVAGDVAEDASAAPCAASCLSASMNAAS